MIFRCRCILQPRCHLGTTTSTRRSPRRRRTNRSIHAARARHFPTESTRTVRSCRNAKCWPRVRTLRKASAVGLRTKKTTGARSPNSEFRTQCPSSVLAFPTAPASSSARLPAGAVTHAGHVGRWGAGTLRKVQWRLFVSRGSGSGSWALRP